MVQPGDRNQSWDQFFIHEGPEIASLSSPHQSGGFYRKPSPLSPSRVCLGSELWVDPLNQVTPWFQWDRPVDGSLFSDFCITNRIYVFTSPLSTWVCAHFHTQTCVYQCERGRGRRWCPTSGSELVRLSQCGLSLQPRSVKEDHHIILTVSL